MYLPLSQTQGELVQISSMWQDVSQQKNLDSSFEYKHFGEYEINMTWFDTLLFNAAVKYLGQRWLIERTVSFGLPLQRECPQWLGRHGSRQQPAGRAGSWKIILYHTQEAGGKQWDEATNPQSWPKVNISPSKAALPKGSINAETVPVGHQGLKQRSPLAAFFFIQTTKMVLVSCCIQSHWEDLGLANGDKVFTVQVFHTKAQTPSILVKAMEP